MADDDRASKKRRVTQSCNTCRKRRVKCDGKEPVCAPCAAKGSECGWTVPRRRGPVPGKNVQAKVQRLSTHLHDLYRVLPGLEGISEMLLGIQKYDPSAVPGLLQPHLPPSLDALLEDSANSHSSATVKHSIFRASAVGRYFDEDQNDGDGENGGDISPPPMPKDELERQHAGSSASTSWLIPHSTADNSSNLFAGHSIPVLSHLNASQQPPLALTLDQMTGSSEQTPPSPFTPATALQMLSTAGPSSTSSYTIQLPSTSLHAPLNGFSRNHTQGLPMHNKSRSMGDISFLADPLATYNSDLDSPSANSSSRLPYRIIWEPGKSGRNARIFGATSGFVDLGKTPPVLHAVSRDAALHALDLPDLPSDLQRNKLFEAYLNIVHPYLPMCSRLDIMQWSCNPHIAKDVTLPWALLYAIFAIATPYMAPSPIVDLHAQASKLRQHARSRILEELHNSSLHTVQAMLLLSLADWGEGQLTLAWVGLAQTIGLALHLGLHVPPTSTTNVEGEQTTRLLTWYSIVVLDTALASQLGRWPLCPGITAVLDLPSSGYDEWDFWKREMPDDLENMYNTSQPTPSVASLAQHRPPVPSRIYSIFNQSVSLAKIAQKILTIANAVERTRAEVDSLRGCWDDLEVLRAQLPELTPEDESIGAQPQHRVDVHLSHLHWRLVIQRELISIGDLSVNAVREDIRTAQRFLEARRRVHTFYRSTIATSLLCFTIATLSSDLVMEEPSDITAMLQLQHIFPNMMEKLLASLPSQRVQHCMSLRSSPGKHGTAINGHAAQSSVVPFTSAASMTYASSLPDDLFSTSSALQMDWASLDHYTNGVLPPVSAQSAHDHPRSQAGQAIGHFTTVAQPSAQSIGLPESYSLPHQALSSLFENGKLDNQKAFDAASWAQTDVIAALGSIDMPRFSRASSPNELSGFTGMLDRWTKGDGDLWRTN